MGLLGLCLWIALSALTAAFRAESVSDLVVRAGVCLGAVGVIVFVVLQHRERTRPPEPDSRE